MYTIDYDFGQKFKKSLPNGCHGNKGPPNPLSDSTKRTRRELGWIGPVLLYGERGGDKLQGMSKTSARGKKKPMQKCSIPRNKQVNVTQYKIAA